MNIVICITIIAITGVLLIKRYQPQPVGSFTKCHLNDSLVTFN